jgi:hypothetical protein
MRQLLRNFTEMVIVPSSLAERVTAPPKWMRPDTGGMSQVSAANRSG